MTTYKPSKCMTQQKVFRYSIVHTVILIDGSLLNANKRRKMKDEPVFIN